MSNAMTRRLLALLLFVSASMAFAVDPPAAAPGEGFSTEQLEQLVAPIALHPDALLTQILMASTYPLEVVEADRWMRGHKDLKGKPLEDALKNEDWDPSVKSLCSLPDVLQKMSENLDWTQDLGDAFLGQKQELLDTVQRMRGKAYEAGNLKSSEQQVVTQQPDKIIVIQQPSPEVVYVPSYSPTVVYGSWSYPSYYYPPMYAPPPPGYGLMAFGVGMAVGAAVWGDCNWGWGHGDVDVDVNRYNNFNRNTNINGGRNQINPRNGKGGRSSWQHDPSHRKGVNYGNQKVAQQYGARGGTNRVSRDQARGRSQSPTASNRASGVRQPDRQAGNRAGASASTRDAGRGATNRPSGGSRDTLSSGARSPSRDRAASSRGSASRGTGSFGGRSSGASSFGGRSGGGMRSGGGGRRR